MWHRRRAPEGYVFLANVGANQRFVFKDTAVVFVAGLDAHRCSSIGCSCDNPHGKLYCVHERALNQSSLLGNSPHGHFDPYALVKLVPPLWEDPALADRIITVEQLQPGQHFRPDPEIWPNRLDKVTLGSHKCGENPCNCKKSKAPQLTCIHVATSTGNYVQHYVIGRRVLLEP